MTLQERYDSFFELYEGQLAARGVLAAVDRPVLAELCRTMAIRSQAWDRLMSGEAEWMVEQVSDKGHPRLVPSKEARILNETATTMSNLTSALQVTIRSRAAAGSSGRAGPEAIKLHGDAFGDLLHERRTA